MTHIRWILLFILLGCGSPEGDHKPIGKRDVQTQSEGSQIGFDKVRPIFAQYCSECHPSRSGPDWLEYSQAKSYVNNGKLLKRAVEEKSMPPPGSRQAVAIRDSDRETIQKWIHSGSVEHSSEGPERVGAPANGPEQKCFQCHGPSGAGLGSQPKMPILAGQNEDYLKLQLSNFKWRARLDPSNAMNEIALSLSDSDIEKTSQYFSHQSGLSDGKPPELDGQQKLFFREGKEYASQFCISCHMSEERNGRTSDELVPILTGQSKVYLTNQLLYFRDDERRSQLMHEYAKVLSNRQIEALAIFFSIAK